MGTEKQTGIAIDIELQRLDLDRLTEERSVL